jgi:hypothetical protein
MGRAHALTTSYTIYRLRLRSKNPQTDENFRASFDLAVS